MQNNYSASILIRESVPDEVDGWSIAEESVLNNVITITDSDESSDAASKYNEDTSDDPGAVFGLFGGPKHQNFLIIYGTKPAGAVALQTSMLDNLFKNWIRK